MSLPAANALHRAVQLRNLIHGPFFWLLSALLFAVLALGPVLHVGGRTGLLPGGGEIPLPYGWLARAVPFLDISRSVSRFDVMIMLSLGVLAAFGLQWLLDHKIGQRGPARWAGLAFAGLVLFEFWPAPYPMSPPDTPGWYASLALDPRPGAVLNLPMNWDRPGYLLYQTVHGKPLAAAYISRDDPRTMVERAPVLQQFRRLGPDIIDFDLAGQGQQALRDLGIRWVVLDRYKMPGERERGYNEDAARRIFGEGPPAYQDERLVVYEVTAGGRGAPYVELGDGWGPCKVDPVTGERARAFTTQASLLVEATAAGPALLQITLAAGSGRLSGQINGSVFSLPVDLRTGMNEVVLRAAQPGERVVVSRISLLNVGQGL